MSPFQLGKAKRARNRKISSHATGSIKGMFKFAIGNPLALFSALYKGACVIDDIFKVAVIDDEMQSRDCYERTRKRDLANGSLKSLTKEVLGKGVGRVVSRALADGSHDALTYN